jgi:hypothetical protein
VVSITAISQGRVASGANPVLAVSTEEGLAAVSMAAGVEGSSRDVRKS